MSIPRITELLSNRPRLHSIGITIVNAAAAQTDTITIDGVACAFTSDATPTKQEVSNGLIAAIAASSVAGMFEVSQGVTPDYKILLRPIGPFLSPSVSVSANLADALSWGVYAKEAKWGSAGSDHEQITVDALKSLTAAKINPAGKSETLVTIQIDTANIRWLIGGNATAAIGQQIAAGDSFTLELAPAALLALTMFPVSGTPIANVQYLYR